jgi:hypothetical protein
MSMDYSSGVMKISGMEKVTAGGAFAKELELRVH